MFADRKIGVGKERCCLSSSSLALLKWRASLVLHGYVTLCYLFTLPCSIQATQCRSDLVDWYVGMFFVLFSAPILLHPIQPSQPPHPRHPFPTHPPTTSHRVFSRLSRMSLGSISNFFGRCYSEEEGTSREDKEVQRGVSLTGGASDPASPAALLQNADRLKVLNTNSSERVCLASLCVDARPTM